MENVNVVSAFIKFNEKQRRKVKWNWYFPIEKQTKPDQDVIDLDSLKHPNRDAEKQEKKLASLETELAAIQTEQHGQEESPPLDTIEKEQPPEADATTRATQNEDSNNENSNANGNGNGNRIHGAQPKVFYTYSSILFLFSSTFLIFCSHPRILPKSIWDISFIFFHILICFHFIFATCNISNIMVQRD